MQVCTVCTYLYIIFYLLNGSIIFLCADYVCEVILSVEAQLYFGRLLSS